MRVLPLLLVLCLYHADESCSAADDVIVSARVAGVERYSTGRWGIVEATFINPADDTREVTVVITPQGGDGDQFVRTVHVPPKLRFSTAWPIYISRKIQNEFDFDFVVLKGGPDSQEIIQRTMGERTDSFTSTNVGGSWSRKNPGGFVPGYCGVLSSAQISQRDNSVVGRLAVVLRERGGLPPMILAVNPASLRGYPESLGPLDQLVITSPELANYPDACDAIRIWIQRGGHALFMLSLCGEETMEAVLGDGLACTVVDETSLMRVPLKHHQALAGTGQVDESHLREFSEPVSMVRAVFEGANTHWSVRGWPALAESRFGSGHVYVATLAPDVFLTQDLYTGLDPIAGRMFEELFAPVRYRPLIEQSELAELAESKIGYVIPGRHQAAILLVTFCVLLAAISWYFWKRGRASALIAAVPVLSVLAAIPGVILGSQSRNVAPATLIESRIARVGSGQSTFATDGVTTYFQPDGGTSGLTFSPHTVLETESRKLPGENRRAGRRYIWPDYALATLPSFTQPAGATSYSQRSVVHTQLPMKATGSLTPEGLQVSISNAEQLKPEDLILANVGPDRMAVHSAGEVFTCLPSDVLAPDQFSNESFLSVDQNRRAEVYRRIFGNEERVKRFPDVPTIMFWTTEFPAGLKTSDASVRHDSQTLLSLPLDLRIPAVGERVTIPPSLHTYHVVPDANGSVSSAYSRRLARWIRKKSSGVTVLKFMLPRACRPFRFESADIQLRIFAGSRTVRLQGGTMDQLKDIDTLDSPVGNRTITIPADVLNLTPEGDSVLLRITVSELSGTSGNDQVNAEQDDFWKIERVLLTVRGHRESPKTTDLSP